MTSKATATGSNPTRIVFTKPIEEVYAIRSVKIEGLDPSFWYHSREYYTANIESIEARWVYPTSKTGAPFKLTYWNLLNEATTMKVIAYEEDRGTQTTYSNQYSFTTVNSSEFNIGIKGTGKVGDIGLEGSISSKISNSQTTNHKVTVSFVHKDNDDHLGDGELPFGDNVIHSSPDHKPVQKEGYTYYPINAVNVGDIEVVVKPRDTNNPQMGGANKRPKTKSGSNSSSTLPSRLTNQGSRFPQPNSGRYSPNHRPMSITDDNPYEYDDDPSMYEL
ncbi:hypothetical protein K5X82_07760 [Halosquirtibacter xylanolyticus]|uniref:hypothetical protein n=1 Tax=Halosquirtibacter xylanolyticus TaxID=3374599 RepID=UPI003749D7DD|nr:hypothetical protein K5X82_07760 [Prolixibacteraceae bacterium]